MRAPVLIPRPPLTIARTPRSSSSVTTWAG